MPTTFACSSHQVLGRSTVTVAGELDLETSGTMRLVGEAALQDPIVSAVAVDCHDVTFIDSTALSVFVAWSDEARSYGKTLTFQRVPRVMSRLMTLTGLDQVLDVTNQADAGGVAL